jgi:hypothetical protein
VDGQLATGAQLNDPKEVLVDSANVYIADTGNNRIQKVAGTSGNQHRRSMTAGDMYTVFGSPSGPRERPATALRAGTAC